MNRMRDLPQFLHPFVGHLRASRDDEFMVRPLQQLRPLFDQLGQGVGDSEQPAV